MRYLFALMGLVAVVMIIGLVGVGVVGHGAPASQPPPSGEAAAGLHIDSEDRARLEQADYLLENLTIDRGGRRLAGGAELIAPAPPPEPGDERFEPDDSRPVALPERRLSLIVMGGDEPRAMIDGTMVSGGSTLSDGGRVERIERDRVIVAERNGRQELAIGREATRVGRIDSGALNDFPDPRSGERP